MQVQTKGEDVNVFPFFYGYWNDFLEFSLLNR